MSDLLPPSTKTSIIQHGDTSAMCLNHRCKKR